MMFKGQILMIKRVRRVGTVMMKTKMIKNMP